MKTRIEITFFLCLVLTLSFTGLGYAQDSEIARYPHRPITLIVPFSAGGTVDLAFRLIGKDAEKYLGQPIVVVNKAGGGAPLELRPWHRPSRMGTQ